MPFASTLLINALLALSVTATPVVKVNENAGVNLPFAMKLNLSGSKLPEADRARAAHLTSLGKRLAGIDVKSSGLHRRASSFSVANAALTYSANVTVGSPGTSYTLLIDTGSSNTWVGANKSYTPSNSSQSTGHTFSASYGSGNASGVEFIDTVALSSSLVVNNQSIGVANQSQGLTNFDGILGLGPVGLTKNTVSGAKQVPTVVDNLHSQNKIDTEVVGISFNPYSQSNSTDGQLSFGGDDSSKYTGSITYASITKKSPAKNFWGFDQSITYGSSGRNILSKTAGILDTGTTMILLATDAYQRYENFTGATFDESSGMLMITNDQYNNLQPLNFNVGKTQFQLSPNAQVWPRSLNTFIGGEEGKIYLVVGDLGKNSGQGLDFINGYSFLERFYSVYDTTNKRVGLATTSNTNATTN